MRCWFAIVTNTQHIITLTHILLFEYIHFILICGQQLFKLFYPLLHFTLSSISLGRYPLHADFKYWIHFSRPVECLTVESNILL